MSCWDAAKQAAPDARNGIFGVNGGLASEAMDAGTGVTTAAAEAAAEAKWPSTAEGVDDCRVSKARAYRTAQRHLREAKLGGPLR
jgi:hypothetical protein